MLTELPQSFHKGYEDDVIRLIKGLRNNFLVVRVCLLFQKVLCLWGMWLIKYYINEIITRRSFVICNFE